MVAFLVDSVVTTTMQKFYIKSILILFAVSIVFTLSSVFWTTDTVHTPDELQHVELGWPVRFVLQNHDRFDPPYPWDMKFVFGSPGVFSWHNFFISTTLNLVLFFICYRSLQWLLFRFK